MSQIREGLTFNDVLLVPKYSEVVSRKPLSLRAKLTNRISLNMPIISSNMDTVTEDKMAIAMAENGGLGIIHRFVDINTQVKMVKRVKRYMNYKIEKPYTINLLVHNTVEAYQKLAQEKGVRGFPIVGLDGSLHGIITNRDVMFASEGEKLRDLMTPFEKMVVGESSIILDEAFDLMKKHKIEKLPIVDHPKGYKTPRLIALITIKDLLHYKEVNKVCTIDSKGRLMVGAAVGVKEEDVERAERLIEAGVDILCVDVAHGHNILCGNMVKTLKEKFPDIDVIAGNVATAEGVRYLSECGADCVKVSIGSGSICTTRMMTGCGVPQLTALFDCVAEAKKLNVPIISDGGNSGVIGNIVKALATGASTVMLGNFLAGTDETPGPVLVKDNKRVKYIRGMSGYGANLSRRQNIESRDDLTDVVPEGVDAYVPYKGPVSGILFQICGGIKSGLSYCGAHSLNELADKAEFIKVTPAGQKNSDHHGVNKL